MEQNTNKQMSLENFKKEVAKFLMKDHGYTTEMLGFLETADEEYLEMCMKDFSPEIAAQGFSSGLI